MSLLLSHSTARDLGHAPLEAFACTAGGAAAGAVCGRSTQEEEARARRQAQAAQRAQRA